MRKIAVLTALYGSEYCITEQEIFENVDFHAFISKDANITSSSWEIHKTSGHFKEGDFQNRLNAKIFKVLPFSFLNKYDYFIWIDNNIKLNEDPNLLIEKYLNNFSLALVEHPKRTCVYQEIKEASLNNLDLQKNLKKQFKQYKLSNYPKHNGLYDCSLIIEKNNTTTKELGVHWWSQIEKFSSRDQISLPYVLNKLEIEPYIITQDELAEKNIYTKSIQDFKTRSIYNNFDLFGLRIKIERYFFKIIKKLLNTKK